MVCERIIDPAPPCVFKEAAPLKRMGLAKVKFWLFVMIAPASETEEVPVPNCRKDPFEEIVCPAVVVNVPAVPKLTTIFPPPVVVAFPTNLKLLPAKLIPFEPVVLRSALKVEVPVPAN